MEINKTGGSSPITSGPDSAGELEVPEFTMPDTEKLKSGDQAYYFELMQKMQAESRTFETMTNILKARDEAAKSAIRNIGH